MIVDYLHSYYTMPARLWVGGVERIVTLRWFRAPAGAKKLPFATCFFTHVDDKVWERNPGEPGELNRSRIHDQGRNNGYQGQCYLGDPQWFLTGQLPASVLNPPPPSACLCQIPPAQATGALVLAGSAVAYPFGITQGCVQCPGGAPTRWLVRVAGGTGNLGTLNGTWPLTYVSACGWSLVQGTFSHQLNFQGSGPWNLLMRNGSVATLGAHPTTTMDCINGGAYTVYSSVGSGTPPTSITVGPQ